MIIIRSIQPHEIPAARRVILTVAYGIFGWDGTLEESIRHFETSGDFADMDDIETHYLHNGGQFLAAFDGDQLVGSGAIRRLDAETAELKRVWLLEQYQGKGIGYAMFGQLRVFARKQGYKKLRLQTSPQQARALAFYRRLGFRAIPCYNEDITEVSMELDLQGTKP